MAWTAPRTYVTGELIDATIANEQWRDNSKALAQLDYVEYTGNVSITATSEGTADTVVTGTSKAYVAEKMWVEFFSPNATPQATTDARLNFLLYEGATVRGIFGYLETPGSATDDKPVLLRRRITPSAGTFSWIVKAYVSTGTGTVRAGAGGSGNLVPGYIAVHGAPAV